MTRNVDQFEKGNNKQNEIRNIFCGSWVKFLKPIRFTDNSSCGSDLHDGDDDDYDYDYDGSTQRKEINRNR